MDAKKSLESKDPNYFLIWVQEKDEAIVLEKFNKILSLRESNPENLENIDKEIISHLNQRTLEDIGSVEKSILRLAVYEILFEELPKAIIINEAIELSKRLASDGAPKFVNGLLDKIVKA